MAKTSKKLYGVKNAVLKRSLNKIDVNSNEELLLLEAPSEHKELYRKLGLSSKQDFVNEQLSDSRELKIFQKRFENAEAFKGHHIKKLCNKYDLMILPISEVKGYLTDSAMKSLKEFNEHFPKTLLSDAVLYILAPREVFFNDYKGKQIKTYIIFYKDSANNSTTSSRKVHEGTVVNQVCSSGNDFSSLRIFNQLFLLQRYTSDSSGMARFWSNLIISIGLWISILFAYHGKMWAATVFFVIYLLAMAMNNIVDDYKDCWNEYSEYNTNHR